ncbi:unnamed protein product [Calypogeia fissa]
MVDLATWKDLTVRR